MIPVSIVGSAAGNRSHEAWNAFASGLDIVWRGLKIAVLSVFIAIEAGIVGTALGIQKLLQLAAKLPDSLGGDVFKAYFVSRGSPSRAAAVVSVIVDRILGITALFFMAAGMLLFQPGAPHLALAKSPDPSTVTAAGAVVTYPYTLTNPANGYTRSVTTGAEGFYDVPLLPPGAYDISYEMSGLASVKRKATVTVGSTVTLNVSMNVGGVAEEVTVVSEAPLVETGATIRTSTLDQDAIANLHRNLAQYMGTGAPRRLKD